MQALGTPAAPIIFTRVPCNENWGHLAFEGAVGASMFTSCEWSWGTGGRGCITATDGDLEFESCTFQDIDGEGLHATGGKHDPYGV